MSEFYASVEESRKAGTITFDEARAIQAMIEELRETTIAQISDTRVPGWDDYAGLMKIAETSRVRPGGLTANLIAHVGRLLIEIERLNRHNEEIGAALNALAEETT